MSSQTSSSSLASLEFAPYLESGQVADRFSGKIGIYAIFDQDKALQYVGYSRDVGTSLKQHLVRCPEACYWVKVQTIDRPSRQLLDDIRNGWLAENGSVPPGNDNQATRWTQPIDAKLTMSDQEQAEYQRLDGLGQIKHLKKIARRLEAEIQQALSDRGVTMELRFNPKLKEQGLLDLK
jgi:hypothetical protein